MYEVQEVLPATNNRIFDFIEFRTIYLEGKEHVGDGVLLAPMVTLIRHCFVKGRICPRSNLLVLIYTGSFRSSILTSGSLEHSLSTTGFSTFLTSTLMDLS